MLGPTGLLELFYPRQCAGCGCPIVDDPPAHVCWNCRAGFEIITRPFCSVCGDPVDGAIEEEYVCAFCRENPPFFDAARSAVRYRGAFRRVLQGFKYKSMVHLGTDLVPVLSACVRVNFSAARLDAVLPVPLHSRRLRERTYNQSAVLARGLGRALRLPCFTRCLRRARQTSTQTKLTMRERAENVKGAFVAAAPEWIDGRNILLVDDVMTTGATVNECARIMKQAGAASVYAVTAGRG